MNKHQQTFFNGFFLTLVFSHSFFPFFLTLKQNKGTEHSAIKSVTPLPSCVCGAHLFSYMPTQLFALSKQVELHQQLWSKAESRDGERWRLNESMSNFKKLLFPLANRVTRGKRLTKGTCHRLPIAKDNDVSIWIRVKNTTLPRLCVGKKKLLPWMGENVVGIQRRKKKYREKITELLVTGKV